MKEFVKLIKEVNATLDGIILFDAILSSVIIFLVCFILLYVTGLPVLLAIFPAFLYLMFKSYTGIRKNKAKLVESKYKELKDKLTTAFDNFYADNEIVNDLQKDIIKQMKKVEVSSFLSIKKTVVKCVAGILLSFVVLLLTVYGVQFDLPKAISKLPEIVRIEGMPGFSSELNGTLPSAGFSGDENIYGEPSVAELGNEELNFEIKPVSFEVDVRNYRDVEEQEFEELFPDEILVESSEGCVDCGYNNFGLEEQEIIKQYFLKTVQ